MIIQELISLKVSQMTSNGDSFTFLHSEKDWQNLKADEVFLPLVTMDMPVVWKPVVTMSGSVEETYTCNLMFAYESNLDDNPDQQYSTLKLAHSALNNFIQLVQQDSANFDTSKLEWSEAYQVISYHEFDRNIDAVIIKLKCVPRVRPDVCIPSYSLPISDCDPATVESSGGLFSQIIASGETFVLPDIDYTITNSEGTTILSGSAEAQFDIIAELSDVTHTDSDGSSVTYPSGKNFVCTPCDPIGISAMPFDDETGGNPNARPFFTLPIIGGVQQLNYFGTKWRFTGYTGGYYDRDTSQYKDVNGNVTTRALAYPNDLRCDWSTLNSDGYFVMYLADSEYLIDTVPNAQTILSGTIIGGFTGFRVGSIKEGQTLQLADSALSLCYIELYNIQFGITMNTATYTTGTTVSSFSSYYSNSSDGNSLSVTRLLICRTTNTSEL